MSIAPYIKVIGRGKDGARPLDTAKARDLFEQVLDGRVTDLEVGAFCLAMRIKGETVEELDGFVQATLARCLPLADGLDNALATRLKGIVVLPSYNGARKLPNLTALLAWTLAQRGVGVLVHGASVDPTRVTTAQVFESLGLPVVTDVAELNTAWLGGQPAFMELASLSPPLARLLAVRWTIGLRNPGHTVAKLLDPFARGDARQTRSTAIPSIRVVNHTHPEYAHSLTGYLTHAHANALLMRGTEGEPVADARRQPRFEIFIDGNKDDALSRAPVEGVLTELPELPASKDAQPTADHIRDVIEGRQPLPASIEAQADCLVQALSRLSLPATPPAPATADTR